MLWEADADQRECLDFTAHCRGAVTATARGIGDAAVSLGLPSRFPLFCSLIHHNASSPAIIPNADYLEHIASLQAKFVSSAWLVRPQASHTIARMDVVLGIVVLEKG